MAKISIIGFGNVAHHLAQAFEDCDAAELVQVYSRKAVIEEVPYASKIVHEFEDLKEADLYIISVSDLAVAEVSEKLPFSGKLVAHTAGSLSIDILDNKNRKAVFYPLQTFSKAKAVDFSSVPICLEAQSEQDYSILESVAKAISKSVYSIDSDQRKAVHVSAVFVSNFTNHMYKIASDICEEHQMPFDILKPLIFETAQKVQQLPPKEAQTGPAIRGDRNTIEAHLKMLSSQNQKDIYELLSNSIQNERKKL